jgi:hypothetical protein
MQTYCTFRFATLLGIQLIGLFGGAVANAQTSPPVIKAEAGFTAKMLVAPGTLYDPLWMASRGNAVWFNDDGGEKGDKGSRMLAIDSKGSLSILADLGKFLPITGWDIAPGSFGKYGGQMFTLAQARIGKVGTTLNHIIQRIEPARDYAASVFCTLPNAGKTNGGIPGFGVDARFGPEGSAFADKFYAITFHNNTIYQVTADGGCRPFVNFDDTGFTRPFALTFSADGKTMFVTVIKNEATPDRTGAVVGVTADGKLEKAHVDLGPGTGGPLGLAIAPRGFGRTAGEVYVAFTGPRTAEQRATGKVVRVDRTGAVHLVASGFITPAGLSFVDDQRLLVSDINGDFIFGGVETPDGFIVEIRAE